MDRGIKMNHLFAPNLSSSRLVHFKIHNSVQSQNFFANFDNKNRNFQAGVCIPVDPPYDALDSPVVFSVAEKKESLLAVVYRERSDTLPIPALWKKDSVNKGSIPPGGKGGAAPQFGISGISPMYTSSLYTGPLESFHHSRSLANVVRF